VLTIADDLHARGIGVWILTGKLSGSYSPAGEGKFFFTMMAAFAELERDIIHERTVAGLAAAKAQGRTGGRPTVMDADKLAAKGREPPAGGAESRTGAPGGSSRMLPTRDVAELPGVPGRSARDKRRAWELQAYRIGKHLRWRERDALAWTGRQAI